IAAIIVAAGQGSRIGGALPKQFQQVGGKPLLAHTLQRFEACEQVHDLVLITPAEWETYAAKEIVDRFDFKKIRKIVTGGKKRQDSVYAGLCALEGPPVIVLVHDAVRPCVSSEKIGEVIEACGKHDAAILAVPVKDTIKVAKDGFVTDTLTRSQLWSVQTPQAFRYQLLSRAYEKAFADGVYQTDDSALVERLGVQVKIVMGEDENIKVTVPRDLQLAEQILLERTG
ncbi:MAG: 2-C-methyl-D-erythritol 4-phosphate cytidylyltransferase, partial [bacterium]